MTPVVNALKKHRFCNYIHVLQNPVVKVTNIMRWVFLQMIHFPTKISNKISVKYKSLRS